MIRKTLGLDVELDLVAVRQAEHFIQSRDARPRNGLLFREMRVLQRSAIVFAKLGQREFVNGDPRMRAGAYFRVDVRIVRNHQHVVFGHRDIHFEEVRADFDCVLEGGNSVLRIHSASAAMSVNQDARSSVDRHKEKGSAGPGSEPPVGAGHFPYSAGERGRLARRRFRGWGFNNPLRRLDGARG